VKTLTSVLSFCCKSGSNKKTQACYWLATNNNTRRYKTERHNRKDNTHRKGQQGRTKTKWAYKKLSTYTQSFGKLQMLKFQNGFFLY
jgi:hypothetical protein